MDARLRNVVRKVVLAARRTQYLTKLCIADLESGAPQPLLAFLRHVLVSYSRTVAVACVEAGFRLAMGPLDARFAENVLRATNGVLSVRCRLSPVQFVSSGFAEVKLEYVAAVVDECVKREAEAKRASELSVLRVIAHTAPVPPPPMPRKHYAPTTMRPASAAPPDKLRKASVTDISDGKPRSATAAKWFSDAVALGRGAWASSYTKASPLR